MEQKIESLSQSAGQKDQVIDEQQNMINQMQQQIDQQDQIIIDKN